MAKKHRLRSVGSESAFGMKQFLASKSQDYFQIKKQYCIDGLDTEMSEFEHDLMNLSPKDRLIVELKILEFHTPTLSSVDESIEVELGPKTIEDMLEALCSDED